MPIANKAKTVVTTSRQGVSRDKVLIIDQKNEKKFKEQSNDLHAFALWLRNSNINMKRCILAMRDAESLAFLGLSSNISRNKVLVEIFFDKNTTSDAQRKAKILEVEKLISSNPDKKYRVMTSKLYKDQENDDNSVGKIIVNLK